MQFCPLVQFWPIPSKEQKPCKIDPSCKSDSVQNRLLVQKFTLVQKCLREKMTLCVNLSLCNFVLSCKNGPVQLFSLWNFDCDPFPFLNLSARFFSLCYSIQALQKYYCAILSPRAMFGTRSKSTQSNLRTAHQLRVRVRVNSDYEK